VIGPREPIRSANIRPVRPAQRDKTAAPVWTATGLERQIFLDQTGRRARLVGLGGVLAALLAGFWLAALVTGALGFANLPQLPGPVGVIARIPNRVVHVAEHRDRRRLVATPGPRSSPA
jgi:hypothetical protein